MKSILLLCSLFLLSAAQAAESPLYLTAAEWAQPRTGSALTQHPALGQAMQGMAPGARLQLIYPGGDEGSLWARELQAWLVALGLSSQQIDLLPGSRRDDAIELRVVGTE